jgi:glucokinase
MVKYYLAFDVGGTEIKANVLDHNGNLYFSQVKSFAAKSNKSKKEILNNFIEIIELLIEDIDDQSKFICGIGFAFPGPFDYEKGISLMQNLDKYDALNQVNVREEILKLLMERQSLKQLFSSELKLIFQNDALLFSLGEAKFGKGKEFNRIACFTIGTGFGSTFIKDGKIVKSEYGIPGHGMIYDQPFKDSIIDDYVSVRGLNHIAIKYFDKDVTGKDLYKLASKGYQQAIEVFSEFGKTIGEAIGNYIQLFNPDVIILGGQISKSYELFKNQLKEQLHRNIEIRVSENTSTSSIYGIFSLLK